MRLHVPIFTIAAMIACRNSTPGLGPSDDAGRDSQATSRYVVIPAEDQSGQMTCANPKARATAQMSKTIYGEHWPNKDVFGQGADTTFKQSSGRGVIVADFDGDTHLDIVVPQAYYGSSFFKNDGSGNFTDEAKGDLAAIVDGNWNGGSAADIDGDGDIDIVLYGMEGTISIGWNDGTGDFTIESHGEWDTWEHADELHLPCGQNVSWADYDRDGDLDAFYARLGGENLPGPQSIPGAGRPFFCDSHLLKNNGDGTFEMMTHLLPSEVPEGAPPSTEPVQETRINSSAWGDFDGNGWMDIYTVSDIWDEDILLLNEGGTFTQAISTGLEVKVAGMGVALGDLNDDLIPDVMVPGIDELPTLVSSFEPGEDLFWVDAAAAWGIQPDLARNQSIAWGGHFQDMNNDGYLDLLVTFGPTPGTQMFLYQPDEIYLGSADTTFSPASETWDFGDTGSMRGVIAADFNGDGWLDTAKREIHGVMMVHLAQCGAASWLEVRLHDHTAANGFAIGARVIVYADDGRRFTRWVEAGSTSFTSGGPPDLHFGLGDVERIDRIEVLWPTGEETIYEGVGVRQIIDIRRTDRNEVPPLVD